MAANKEKLTFMKKWYDDIRNDENLEITNQEMAYILFASAIYAFEGEKINIGDVFGKEFKGLNMAMPNIYGQIDNINDYNTLQSENNIKYDDDAIYKLAMTGMKGTKVWAQLGYNKDKVASLYTNKGWIKAQKELKSKQESSLENLENLDSEENLENKGVLFEF